MVLLDASVVIDYLAGDDEVVTFVQARADEQLRTIPLVAFEVYQGEVFKPSPTDFDRLETSLGWLTITETDRSVSRQAAELQNRLQDDGAGLGPRDAFIAGAVAEWNELLAHRDDDFDSPALAREIDLREV